MFFFADLVYVSFPSSGRIFRTVRSVKQSSKNKNETSKQKRKKILDTKNINVAQQKKFYTINN